MLPIEKMNCLYAICSQKYVSTNNYYNNSKYNYQYNNNYISMF